MAKHLTYSIRDLQELTGIPAHTIRTWERRYRLFSPKRNSCNARCYSHSDISFLNHVSKLLRQGYRISSLAGKSMEDIEALARNTDVTPIDGNMTAHLDQALQEFDAGRVENLMSCYIRKEGFDTAFITRFVPFLDQLSLLLLSGVLQPVHSQLFMGVFRQKLNAALDGISSDRDAPRYVLVHDNESTDLIYRDAMHYLLKKVGKQVIPAGALSPESIAQLGTAVRPAGYCLVCANEIPSTWLQQSLSAIEKHNPPRSEILVMTPAPDFQVPVRDTHVHYLSGLKQAYTHLSI